MPPSPLNHENPLLKDLKNRKPRDNVKKALFKTQKQPNEIGTNRSNQQFKQVLASKTTKEVDLQR
mgnify:CR=1 FL=1|jgi:hypothetical protein